MKPDDNSLDSTLDRYMGQAGEPPAGQVASSVEAVWERLRPEAECSTLPAREMVTRRSHFIVAAAVVIATVAIGLYAAQRTGLLQAMLPFQQQAKPQIAPASYSPAVSVNPVRERVTIGDVAESKDPVITSEPRQPAGVAVAEAILSTRQQPSSAAVADVPQITDAGVNALRQIDAKPSQRTTTPATPLAFEVASIRETPPPFPTGGGPWTVTNGQFRAENAWVRGVIGWAYEVMAPQVKGGPEWINRERYDFDARAASLAAGPNQIRVMLRTLLAERFKLVVHRDTEEAQVYTLVVARSGSKLENARGGQRGYINWTGPGHATFSENTTLLGLRNVLAGLLGVPVLDETGLNGTYNFNLAYTDPRDPRPRQADSPPDVFTAVREQLGLELRATRRPVEIIVIDNIEKPSPN